MTWVTWPPAGSVFNLSVYFLLFCNNWFNGSLSDEETLGLRREVRQLQMRLSTCSSTASAIAGSKTVISGHTSGTRSISEHEQNWFHYVFNSLPNPAADKNEPAAGSYRQWNIPKWGRESEISCCTFIGGFPSHLNYFFLPFLVLKVLALTREVQVLQKKIQLASKSTNKTSDTRSE